MHFMKLRFTSSSSSAEHVAPPPTPVNEESAVETELRQRLDKSMQDVANLNLELSKRDKLIDELNREIDKLKSVLQQNSANVSSLPAEAGAPHRAAPATIPEEENYACPDNLCMQAKAPEPVPSTMVHKRQGISAEPSVKSDFTTTQLQYYEKDAKSRSVIRQALRENDFLKNMDAVQLQEMVSCMQEKTVPEGCYLIREGDDGKELYVGAEGQYEVWKDGKYLCTMSPGRCFGELALLYNCKRTASVKAVDKAKVWLLDRQVFQAIMMKTGMQRMQERQAFLHSVPLLKSVTKTQLMRIADVLEAQFHSPGDCIIREGELADSFFIIQTGTVIVTKHDAKLNQEVEVRTLTKGQYFGEKALLSEVRRTANIYALDPGVDLLCLYRKDFHELIGNIQELREKEYSDEQQLVQQNLTSKASGDITDTPLASPKALKCRQESFDPAEYTLVSILGLGGFGRVELVYKNGDTTKSFALKRMKKSHIVKTKQQDHVMSEKGILMSIDCAFVCKLFATAKDNRFVYLLMEVCLGGELWTILRDLGHLTDKHVRFSLACVIEAFSYLHQNGIVYRDLKPENLVVADRGYLKLCDFGFAKYIGIGNKTWTFCGTPEYVAPEIILNKGHDFAADYWSLGILTCELLTGSPPFQASEPIRIYMKTLKGIESLELNNHKYISQKAYHFVKKLCRANPAERLGVGKNGLEEIRSHKYFQGFDWEGISKQALQSPIPYKLNGPLDTSNFDQFPNDEIRASIEESGWDVKF